MSYTDKTPVNTAFYGMWRHETTDAYHGLKIRTMWVRVPPDHARAMLENNPKPSSAGGCFWELSGGVFVCGGCGHRMQSDRKRRSATTDRYHHYYKCPNRRPRYGILERCPGSRKSYKAEEIEALVWDFVSGIFKDPARLRVGLEKRVEEERLKGTRGDPEREAKGWLDKLTEAENERRGYLRLAAKGRMRDEELDRALAELAVTRAVAERELEALENRRERIEQLEHDKDALLASLEGAGPEVLDSLPPESRNRIYKMLSLKVEALPDEPLKLSGVFAGNVGVCSIDTTSSSGPALTCRLQMLVSSPVARHTCRT